MTTNSRSTILAILSTACLAVTATVGIANAQSASSKSVPAEQFQVAPDWGAPAQAAPPMMQFQPIPQGVAPVMIQDTNYLYIMRGNEVFRMYKETLKVEATGRLPEPRFKAIPLGAPERATRSGGDEKIQEKK